MNRKKTAAPLLAAALVAVGAGLVMAEDVSAAGSVSDYQNVTNEKQAGSTTVIANVAEVDAGDVTYTLSIPSKVDFGSLQPKSADDTDKTVEVDGSVSLTQVEGLGEDQRIAVLVKDSIYGDTENHDFKIRGTTGAAASNGKELKYDIVRSGSSLKEGTFYSNGYLVGNFSQQDDESNLTFSLNQAQLIGEVGDWEGFYQGTVTFYSKVASKTEYD